MGLNILLADDDKDDRFFFNLAVTEVDTGSTLATVPNGEQLILTLSETTDNLPNIVFLDLNMPRKNGFICLDEIRKDPKLQQLFVAIYTTSNSPKDVSEAFEKGANLFVNKPNGYDDLKVIVAKILGLDLSQYPPHSNLDKFVLIPQECKW
jgi:CheY-like chemotaxis protein